MFDFYSADLHFNHLKIIEFEPELRPFKNLEEHNEEIIKRHNARVGKNDKWLCLGDVAFNTGLPNVARMNGKKTLIMGNHEHKHVLQYTTYFDHIHGSLDAKELKTIFTHIPVHPSQLDFRFKRNVHGHVHRHSLIDPRYVNVSLEVIGLAPITHDELLDKLWGWEHEEGGEDQCTPFSVDGAAL